MSHSGPDGRWWKHSSLWNEISLACWVLKDYDDVIGFWRWHVSWVMLTSKSSLGNWREEALLFRQHREVACLDSLGGFEVSKCNYFQHVGEPAPSSPVKARQRFTTTCSMWVQERRNYASWMSFVPRLLMMAAIGEEILHPDPSYHWLWDEGSLLAPWQPSPWVPLPPLLSTLRCTLLLGEVLRSSLLCPVSCLSLHGKV